MTNANRSPLTTLEALALQGAADGWDSFALGRAEGRSAKSIRSRWSRARYKLGAVDTAHAVLLAMRAGVIQ